MLIVWYVALLTFESYRSHFNAFSIILSHFSVTSPMTMKTFFFQLRIHNFILLSIRLWLCGLSLKRTTHSCFVSRVLNLKYAPAFHRQKHVFLKMCQLQGRNAIGNII